MSQGMIDTARQQARAMAAMLRPYLDQGRKIVVVEPSVLAMLRFDFKHLLDDEATIAALAANSFEPLQALWDIATRTRVSIWRSCFRRPSRVFGTRLFYHSHCQQRTCNAAYTDHRRAARRGLRRRDLIGGVLWHGGQLRLQARLLRAQHGGGRGPVRPSPCRRNKKAARVCWSPAGSPAMSNCGRNGTDRAASVRGAGKYPPKMTIGR